MAITEPIKDKAQLKRLAELFLHRGQFRNYTLVILGASTALRIGDLLRLKWSDVYDSENDRYHSHITVVEQKTHKCKIVALNANILDALRLYRSHSRGNFIFSSNRKEDKAISRVQAWRIIQSAVEEIGIEGKVSCHSLRKTWGYHAWTSGKVSPVVIMDILNHSDYETTRKYLGVAQDDLDRAYRDMLLF